jgi:DNA-binding CsgD family transcriptional regulator
MSSVDPSISLPSDVPPQNHQHDRLAGRNGEIWRMYTSGLTQQAIAARLGMHQSSVSNVLKQVRDALPADERDDWRIIAIETLRELHAVAVEIVRSDPPPTFHQGEPLRDENGEIVRDASTRLVAIDRLIRIQERAARALGTDSPDKLQVGATVRYTVNGVDPEALK